MKYEIVRKKKTWREIHVSAETLKSICGKLEKLKEEDYSICEATLVFEKGSRENDETLYFKKGRVRMSSFARGLVEWDSKKRQYVAMYHGMERPLGQLIRIEFPYNKQLEDLLKTQ